MTGMLANTQLTSLIYDCVGLARNGFMDYLLAADIQLDHTLDIQVNARHTHHWPQYRKKKTIASPDSRTFVKKTNSHPFLTEI